MLEALDALNIVEEKDRANLKISLRSVAEGYWAILRQLSKPSPRWYREQVQPIQKATTQLLQLVRKRGEGTSRTTLSDLTRLRMNRPLRGSGSGSDPESIEQLLEGFKRVCDECLRRRGFAGAPEKKHVEASVAELATIWKDYRSAPMPLSLDTDVGPGARTEFIYPGPRFVQGVMQAIDPELSIGEIDTALRKVLGKLRVRKTAPR